RNGARGRRTIGSPKTARAPRPGSLLPAGYPIQLPRPGGGRRLELVVHRLPPPSSRLYVESPGARQDRLLLKEMLDALHRLPRAVIILYQAEAHEALSHRAETDARRDCHKRLLQQKLGKVERRHVLKRLGNPRPHEHRCFRWVHAPTRAVQPFAKQIASSLVNRANLRRGVL